MMQGSVHPVPRMRDVVREQIRIVALGLRPVALVAAIVFGIITILIFVSMVQGNAHTWFDSDEWREIGVLSFLFPFAVWWRERRYGPGFLWTLPVDRRRLALARVFAGWVWLMAALVMLVSWQFILARLAGVSGARIVSANVFGGTTAIYLLGSALVLGLRHPLRWLLGTAVVLFLVGMFNDMLSHGPHPLDPLQSASGFLAAAQQALSSIFLWLGVGLLALWAALSRHGEHRRH